MSSGECSEVEAEAVPTLPELVTKNSKQELSSWLEVRGLPKTGRTKEILAKRVLRHIVGDSSDGSSDSDAEVNGQQ